MQNEPNFGKAQMNVNVFPTKDYENKSNWTLGENEPNSKPNKPNFIHHSLGEGGFKRDLVNMGNHERVRLYCDCQLWL